MAKKDPLIKNEFSEYVEDSVSQMNIKKNIYIESYLTSLLSNFIKKGKDFLADKTLIFRFMGSKSLDDFVGLGDETLFMTGFFPENILKDKKWGYTINIGKDSYSNAAVILNYEGYGYIYAKLAIGFEKYSEILNNVKYNMLEKIEDQEFLTLYKTWRDYKNLKALKKIKENRKNF